MSWWHPVRPTGNFDVDYNKNELPMFDTLWLSLPWLQYYSYPTYRAFMVPRYHKWP